MSGADDDFDPGDSASDPDTKYRFVPVVRRGYPPDAYFDEATARAEDGVESSGTLHVDFEVAGHGGTGPTREQGGVDLELYGPGHVTGLDDRQVVRMEPEPGTSDYPPNYFATVEFDAPDLPWLFSPVSDDTLDEESPGGTGKGFPWCCLVVVEETEATTISPAGSEKPLPSIEVPPVELPPLDEAWAWTHAQVVGSPQQHGDGTLDDAFRSASTLTRSRLISPRNLRANTAYVAAVVPTFEAGVRAGLGRPDPAPTGDDEGDTTASFAWPVAATADGDDPSEDPIELPLLHFWRFSTGKQGDFEFLARRLEPRNLSALDAPVGVRTVDASDPGPSTLEVWGSESSDDDRTVRMGGALRKAGSDPIGASDYGKRDALRSLLNEPAGLQEWTDEPYEAVGPPIYGTWHAQVESLPATFDDDQRWLRDINLHPGNRLAAAVGADIVRDNQAQLMEQAWEQVGDVRAANRLLAAAGLSRATMEASLETLRDAPTGWLASFVAPMHDRRLDGDRTVGAKLDDSTLPRGLLSAPFRRLTSGAGRLSKRLDGPIDLGDLVSAVAAGEIDVATRTAGPAGMGVVAADVDLAEVCRALPAPPTGGTGDEPPGTGREKPVPALLEQLDALESALEGALESLSELATALEETPADEYFADGSPIPGLLGAIEGHWDEVAVFADVGEKAMMAVAAAERQRDLEGVSSEFTTSRVGRLMERLRDVAFGTRPLVDHGGVEDPPTAADVDAAEAAVFRALVVHADILGYLEAPQGSSDAFLDALVCDAVPEDVSRPAPDLESAATLDPVPHLVDRIGSRLSGIDLEGPGRADPLDRVMAYPEFPTPTYRDLAADSEDLLLPGVSEIPRNTVGVLETNPQFIESFLVGMNHEMAAELLWRRYPTDRRGSYFRQFWDPSARVPKPDDEDLLKDVTPVHTWDDKGPNNVGPSELGSNVTTGATDADAGRGAEPNAQVVVIIRGDLLQRYPTTTVYATKAKRAPRDDGEGDVRVPEWPTPNEKEESVDTAFHRFPIFRGRLDPDVTFLGFDLTAEEATGDTPMESVGEPDPGDDDHWVDEDGTDDLGWFFVLAESPGEVRFGLDADQGDAGTVPPGVRVDSGPPAQTDDSDEHPEHGWSALSWGHLVDDVSALETKQNVSVYGDRPGADDWSTEAGDVWATDTGAELTAEEAAVWGMNGAHMAYITWQRPVRIAIHADDLLPTDDGQEEG